MRIHVRPLVSIAALSLGVTVTSIPAAALGQDTADGGPVRRWPSGVEQPAPNRAGTRVAVARDAPRAASTREQPAAGVSSIDRQMADQRRLEQRRSPGGSSGGGGGGRGGGGAAVARGGSPSGGGGAVARGGSPSGGAGPRVAVPRGTAAGGRGYYGGGRYYGGGPYYGAPYYGRFYYGAPYYYPYYYPYYATYFGGYYYNSYAWGSVGFGVGWGWPGPYPAYAAYPGYYGYDLGRLRLQVVPKDAEVFIDGYYAGQVDDFDGRLQGLDLETGGYSVEVRKPGWETLTFDVRVTPGRTTTYKAGLVQQRP